MFQFPLVLLPVQLGAQLIIFFRCLHAGRFGHGGLAVRDRHRRGGGAARYGRRRPAGPLAGVRAMPTTVRLSSLPQPRRRGPGSRSRSSSSARRPAKPRGRFVAAESEVPAIVWSRPARAIQRSRDWQGRNLIRSAARAGYAESLAAGSSSGCRVTWQSASNDSSRSFHGKWPRFQCLAPQACYPGMENPHSKGEALARFSSLTFQAKLRFIYFRSNYSTIYPLSRAGQSSATGAEEFRLCRVTIGYILVTPCPALGKLPLPGHRHFLGVEWKRTNHRGRWA